MKNIILGKILEELNVVVNDRFINPKESSYTSKLLVKDTERVAQKVGEEALEVAIASVMKNKKATMEESADLLFHLLVLWKKMDIELDEIAMVLEKRKK